VTEHSGLRRLALAGGFWSFVQAGYGAVLGLVTVGALARILEPSEFGLFATALVFTSVVSLLADFGFVESLVRFTNVSRRVESTAFTVSLLVGFVLALLLMGAARWIAELLGEPAVSPLLVALSPAFVLVSLRIVPMARMTRSMNFRGLAQRQAIAATIAAIAALTSAYAGLGPYALVIQTLTLAAMDATLLAVFSPWAPRFTLDRQVAAELWKFGLPYTGTQVVHLIRERGIELGIAVGMGSTALGFWVIANRLAGAAVQLFTSVVNAVSLPVFSRVAGDIALLQSAYRAAVSVCANFVLPGMLIVAILSPSLVPMLFGAEWAGASLVAGVIAATHGLNSVTWLEANVWWAVGRPRVEFALTVLITVAVILLTLIGVLSDSITLIASLLLARVIITIPIRFWILGRIARIRVDAFWAYFAGCACACGAIIAPVWLEFSRNGFDFGLATVNALLFAGSFGLLSVVFRRTELGRVRSLLKSR
jgi:O-antigen/teichoic acid export membrane protein